MPFELVFWFPFTLTIFIITILCSCVIIFNHSNDVESYTRIFTNKREKRTDEKKFAY